jgi:hypothetical protein
MANTALTLPFKDTGSKAQIEALVAWKPEVGRALEEAYIAFKKAGYNTINDLKFAMGIMAVSVCKAS